MFANFTEETCTGTGLTLALAGVTTGNIAFSKSFADGEPVAYVLEDSGGIIKVAGVGTYVSATNDITRNDIWNWNGIVIDDNPTTNIELSGGTHTVRCDVIGLQLTSSVGEFVLSASANYNMPSNIIAAGTAVVPITDRLYLHPCILDKFSKITKVAIEVNVIDAAALNTRVGVYSSGVDGSPDKLLFDSGNLAVGVTGLIVTTLSSPVIIPKGRCWFAFLTDATVLDVDGVSISARSPAGGGVNRYSSSRSRVLYQSSVAGALPATVVPTGDSGSDAPIFGWQ